MNLRTIGRGLAALGEERDRALLETMKRKLDESIADPPVLVVPLNYVADALRLMPNTKIAVSGPIWCKREWKR